MRERGDRLRFAFKAREPIRIGRDGGRQNLDRDLTPQFRIARPIDLAHAAGTNRRDDFIGADDRARGKAHHADYTVVPDAHEALHRRGSDRPAPGDPFPIAMRNRSRLARAPVESGRLRSAHAAGDNAAMQRASGFKGKVGLVVGGASGMGNAVVRLLSQEGVRTHVLDIKATADGVFQSCDIQDYRQVRQCVQRVMAQEGRIDLLFIAAGVHLFATIEETSVEDFERVLSINLKGPFYVLKEVLPIMRQQRSGNIVLMGSDQVFVGKGSSAVYGLSKAALGQLTKSTAIDYAAYNVRVNCICPGTIETPMLGPTIQRFHEASGTSIDDIYALLRKAQPIQRLGTPDEIGRAVLFLLSDDCAFMTGALVSADGGYTCQ